MNKAVSISGLIISLGLVFLLYWLAKFLKRLKLSNPLIKVNTGNEKASEVYFLLIEKGFNYKQARFITAQAGHESGDFKSDIFRDNNNCFGMKMALIRKTTATGEKHGHATYIDLESCIEDFRLYYLNFKYLPVYETLDEYVKALKKRGYFQDSETNYWGGCTYFFNKYFSNNGKE